MSSTPEQGNSRFVSGANRGLDVVGHPITLSVVLSLVIGALIIAASGSSPIGAFGAMVDSAFSTSGLRNTLVRMVPIAGMAFVFAIPYRSGVSPGGTGEDAEPLPDGSGVGFPVG